MTATVTEQDRDESRGEQRRREQTLNGSLTILVHLLYIRFCGSADEIPPTLPIKRTKYTNSIFPPFCAITRIVL